MAVMEGSMGFMTRELAVLSFIVCILSFFVHMPRECQDESFLGNEKKKLTHSFLSERF